MYIYIYIYMRALTQASCMHASIVRCIVSPQQELCATTV